MHVPVFVLYYVVLLTPMVLLYTCSLIRYSGQGIQRHHQRPHLHTVGLSVRLSLPDGGILHRRRGGHVRRLLLVRQRLPRYRKG